MLIGGKIGVQAISRSSGRLHAGKHGWIKLAARVILSKVGGRHWDLLGIVLAERGFLFEYYVVPKAIVIFAGQNRLLAPRFDISSTVVLRRPGLVGVIVSECAGHTTCRVHKSASDSGNAISFHERDWLCGQRCVRRDRYTPSLRRCSCIEAIEVSPTLPAFQEALSHCFVSDTVRSTCGAMYLNEPRESISSGNIASAITFLGGGF